MTVLVHNFTGHPISIARIKIIVRKLLLLVGLRQVSLGVSFVSPQQSKALNFRYRRKRRPTTILTFIYSTGKVIQGDMVLCLPVIFREAKAHKKNGKESLLYILLHGLLHLKGYDHKNSRDQKRMELIEARLMHKLNVSKFKYLNI